MVSTYAYIFCSIPFAAALSLLRFICVESLGSYLVHLTTSCMRAYVHTQAWGFFLPSALLHAGLFPGFLVKAKLWSASLDPPPCSQSASVVCRGAQVCACLTLFSTRAVAVPHAPAASDPTPSSLFGVCRPSWWGHTAFLWSLVTLNISWIHGTVRFPFCMLSMSLPCSFFFLVG